MREIYLLATASNRFDRRPEVGFRALTEQVVRGVLTDARLGDAAEGALGEERRVGKSVDQV